MPIGQKNAVIPGCGTHHIAIQTSDWEESLRLYRDVLGMPVVAEFGKPERKVVLVDTGDGSHIELFQPTGETTDDDAPPRNLTITHFSLTTTDTRAAVERVRESGFPVTYEPTDIVIAGRDVRIAFIKGPSGESIEFLEER